MKKSINTLFLWTSCFILFLTCFLGWSNTSAFALEITGIVSDQSGNMLLIQNSESKPVYNYRTIQLTDPDRYVIDIMDATLNVPKSSISVAKNGINNIRFAQFSTSPEKIVRVVITAQSKDILDKMSLSPAKNALLIQLNTIPSHSTQIVQKPATSTISTIEKIYVRDGELVIQGNSVLQAAEPYILKSPTRVVYELTNAKLQNNELSAPILGDDESNIKLVNIFQTGPTQVNVVVETDKPQRLYPIYSYDQQSIIISSDPITSIARLPQDSGVGYLKNIDIQKETAGTILRIESSSTIIHRLKRLEDTNQVAIDLLNLKSPDANKLKNSIKTPEIANIQFKPLSTSEENSRLIISLASPGISFRSSLNDDGKTLELYFTPSKTISNKFIAKSSGQMRVVIDAGHGGYDNGASRAGVLEKDITLDVSRRLKKVLESRGVKVYMTRESDQTLSLAERTTITNQIIPDAFVSVHVNSSTRTSPTGIETYWYKKQGIPLANTIHNRLVNKTGSSDRGVRQAMFYVIHHTDVPAVLVEIGYISNPSERAALLTANRKNATAEAIADGIIQFLGGKMAASYNPQ